jgi:membrane-associated phospholipid phosphatase
VTRRGTEHSAHVRNWDEWARLGMLYTAVGILTAQPLVTVVEWLGAWPGPVWSVVVFCTLVGPAVAIPAGLYLTRRTPAPAQVHWQWIALSLVVMGGWSAAYFATGALVQGRSMITLRTGLDDAIAFWAPSAWIYFTYYWLLVTPYLRPGSLPMRKAVLANLLMLVVIGVCFVAMPVTMDRPPVDESTMSLYALGVLQGSDPAHNCFPSVHCANALLAGLLLRETGSRFWPLAVAYALVIGVTTLTTKQHWIADVVAGFGLALVIWMAVFRPWRPSAPNPLTQA